MTAILNEEVIAWLLEESNPAVRYRTKIEMLNESADKQPVIDWITGKLPTDWRERTGLWRTYFLTAIAECGLSADDFDIDKNFALMIHDGDGKIENSCDDFMYFRALVQLGLGNELIVQNALRDIVKQQLPDGGFLCQHRLNKLKYIPKSCVKANMHALLLAAVCRKKNVTVSFTEELLNYFWNHKLFYHSDNSNTLILNVREGWRMIDTFYPFEVMRVGLQNIVESFTTLGYGNDVRLLEAWSLLDSKKGKDGKYILNGTLTKSYLPKEPVGKPSKWVTFYALLAYKEKCYKKQ